MLAAQHIPLGVQAAWQASAAEAWPGLTADAATWACCATALAQFFEACRLQRRHGPCALPSRAADSVWHVWLAVDAAGLAAWQHELFGEAVAHRESADLGAALESCLARTLVGASRAEGRSVLDGRLPLVFALDGDLRLPTGWAYAREGGRVVHRQIDGFGRPGAAAHAHAALSHVGLAGLGLLSSAEIERLRRASNHGPDGGLIGTAATGPGCSDSSSDGGSDGGSCGSSCGGGGD